MDFVWYLGIISYIQQKIQLKNMQFSTFMYKKFFFCMNKPYSLLFNNFLISKYKEKV